MSYFNGDAACQTIEDNFVYIKYKSSNYAKKIRVHAQEVKLEKFPEEVLSFHVCISPACDRCLKNMFERNYKGDNDCILTKEDPEIKALPTQDSCSCERDYYFQVGFQNALHCMSSDYYYKVSGKLLMRSGKEILLFSYASPRKFVVMCANFDRNCQGKCDMRNISYSEISEISFEIRRQKMNEGAKSGQQSPPPVSQFYYNDTSSESVILKVSGKTFHVNKRILSAKSPVFRKMFSLNQSGKKSKTIVINDFDAEVIDIMLQFMYSNETRNVHKRPVNVFQAARKYEIEDLMEKCVEWLQFNIDVDNFVNISRFASFYELSTLQEGIPRFEEFYKIKLIQNRNYRKFLLDNLGLNNIVKILKLCIFSDFKDEKGKVFDFFKQNLANTVTTVEFQDLIKPKYHELIQELFLFLSNEDDNKKRKLSHDYLENKDRIL